MSTTSTITTTAPFQPISASASDVPRGPVTTQLTFYKEPADGSKPFTLVEKAPEGQPQHNWGSEIHSVTIGDIRGRESSFTLDESAFAALQNVPETDTDFSSDDSIKATYYPQVEKVLLQSLGLEGKPGAKVLLFDHTIRRARPNAHRSPVTRAHIDQTARSARLRVDYHLPDEAPNLLRGRYRIINVWRPLNGTVESFPLAVADARTVKEEDVVPVEHRYPHRTGETAGIRYDGDMRWYYWSGMGNTERLLLQCYDSQNEGARVPHTAFVDPRSGPGARPRESIEVRALVFG
jgi:hypothetical protein